MLFLHNYVCSYVRVYWAPCAPFSVCVCVCVYVCVCMRACARVRVWSAHRAMHLAAESVLYKSDLFIIIIIIIIIIITWLLFPSVHCKSSQRVRRGPRWQCAVWLKLSWAGIRCPARGMDSLCSESQPPPPPPPSHDPQTLGRAERAGNGIGTRTTRQHLVQRRRRRWWWWWRSCDLRA